MPIATDLKARPAAAGPADRVEVRALGCARWPNLLRWIGDFGFFPFVSARRACSLSLLAACALALAWAPPAFGHAAFLGAQPEPGVRLEAAPTEIVLSFTEPLNARLSRATLVSVADGKKADATTEASAHRLLLRPKAALATGAYRVRWHTVSTEDGHALEGTFSFGVRAAAAGGEHVLQQSPFARDGWVRVLSRALFYVAALLFVGALLLRTLLSGRGSWLAPRRAEGVDVAAVARREREVVVDVGWASAGLAAAVALAEAADAAGGLSLGGTRDFLAGSVAGAGRAATVILFTTAALLVGRRPRVAAVFGVAAFGALAASGHAASADPRLPSVINDWVHLLAGAVWLGGIGLIGVVWAPVLRGHRAAAREALARWVLPAFGRVALPAFVLATLTGLVSLLTQLGHVSALWQTAYGRILAVKIALVALIAVASYVHAIRLRPRLLSEVGARAVRLERRHWRLLRSEPVLALGVVVAVAVLVAFPLPPRQLGEAQDAVAAAPPCDPCPQPSPAENELAVADNAGANVVAGWLRRDGGVVEGTVRITDIRAKPVRTPVTVLGAEQKRCGVGCVEFAGVGAATVRVALRERGRTYVAKLPARWSQGDSARARRLLEDAQAEMRGLRSLRQTERVSSGPGSYARTDYRLKAPNRMAWSTGTGAKSVLIDDTQWMVWPGQTRWELRRSGRGEPFTMRRWFRWTPYAQHIRLLGGRTHRGRRAVELALFDPGTPLWTRLTVDVASRRVLDERSITKAHFTTQRYYRFNLPVTIRAPEAGDDG